MTKHVVVTGPIGIGKTTVCRRVMQSAQSLGYVVRGVLAPALYDEGGEKVGIALYDVASGLERLLARVGEARNRLSVGRYAFDQEVLEWGRQILEDAPIAGCDLLVVDELGPLELQRDGGLAIALDLLRANLVPRSLVIVRETLLQLLQRRLSGVSLTPCRVTAANRDKVPAEILTYLFPQAAPHSPNAHHRML